MFRNLKAHFQPTHAADDWLAEVAGTLQLFNRCVAIQPVRSYSTGALWMSDGLQAPVSRSYLAKLYNGTISASLAEAHEELRQAIT